MSKEKIIPLGRLASGIFTSSATAAIFVTPAYETKTNAAVSAIDSQPPPKAPLETGLDQSGSAVSAAHIEIPTRKTTDKETIGA